MSSKAGLIFQLFMLLLPLSLLAQQPAFRNYSVDEGLPSSEVYHVIQDTKGYIWLATNMGVSRFDGREFLNFDVQNGLPENTVFEIFEDEIGRLWFISFPFQLSYYQNDSIHPYKYNGKLKELAGHGMVPLKKCFRADRNDNIWFSLLNDGSIYTINKTGTISKVTELNESSPTVAIREISGQIIAAQTGARTNTYTMSIVTSENDLNVKVQKTQTKYSGGYLIVERTKNGEILFAQNEVLTIIYPGGNHFSINLNDRILWIKPESDGGIWIGKEFSGADKYSLKDLEEGNSPIVRYLNTKSVTAILKDNEEGLWFTTQGNGVYYLPSRAFISYRPEDGLSGENIKYIEQFQGKVYLGSEESYFLDVLENGKIHTVTNFGQDKNKIKALKSYKDMTLWIGTEKYLHSYNGKKFSTIFNNHPLLHNNHINSTLVFGIKDIYPVNQSEVLLGQMRSLAIVKDGNVTFDSYLDSEISLRVEAIERVDDNTYLLGTFNGLWKLMNKELTYLGNQSDLLKQRITDITSYNNGQCFVLATKGTGLIVITKDTIFPINHAKGLSSNSVTSLLSTDNEIWAATNTGLNLIKVDKIEDKEPNILVFNKQQGLVSNEINQIKGSSDVIYIATNKGLTVFNRKDYIPLKNASPVYIHNISINKKDTVFDNFPVLNYDQNFITITYGGVNFRDAGQLLYKYRLIGLNNNWVYSRNLQVEYGFLPSGKYKFEVYAINSEGLTSLKPAAFGFRIKPPFWKTWWFIMLIVMLIVFMFYSYFTMRIKTLRKEHAIQSDIGKYREQALIRQMDPHFVFNSLNSIQSFIMKNDVVSSTHYLSKFARLMRLILNNSQKQAVCLSDEIDALSLYLELESMRFQHKFEYKITLDPQIETDLTFIPAFLVQPFVENAIWHGIMHLDKPGFIYIDFLKDGSEIICTIEDNGIGRAKSMELKSDIEKRRKSMGISIVESRLNLLSNYYNLKLKMIFTDVYNSDNTPAGTKVTINLPIIK